MESMAGNFSVMKVIAMAALALACSFTYAYDNSPLQNICVAAPDNSTTVHVNGKPCKDPNQVTIDDFVFSGLQVPANTNSPLGVGVTVVDVNHLPGLNTLGISITRADFAPNGMIPLHLHPRASELLVVTEGSVYAGFVHSISGLGAKSKVFAKVLKPGDAFAFPIGAIHFVYNVGTTNASVIAALNSQNFGFVSIPADIFGTDPLINPDMIAKGFQLDRKLVDQLQSLKWYS